MCWGCKTLGGGNSSWTCNSCKIKFNRSYSRINIYLLKVSGVGIQSCSKVDFILEKELKKRAS